MLVYIPLCPVQPHEDMRHTGNYSTISEDEASFYWTIFISDMETEKLAKWP
jgi:hypothetical protein